MPCGGALPHAVDSLLPPFPVSPDGGLGPIPLPVTEGLQLTGPPGPGSPASSTSPPCLSPNSQDSLFHLAGWLLPSLNRGSQNQFFQYTSWVQIPAVPFPSHVRGQDPLLL